jgi:NTE family protein
MERKYADGVFEGGGVKGIGLVGALVEAEKYYKWKYTAGTSAGSIVAALISAGYTAYEIKQMVKNLDYTKFKDKGFLDKIPIFGKILSLGFENGIYEGDYIEQWIEEKLNAKNIRTFKDLIVDDYKDYMDEKFKYKLKVIVSDISREKLLVLPQDIKEFGVNPDDLKVSKAIRMSISIPFFFEPVKQYFYDKNNIKINKKFSYIVDGGILSNFPIWLFDSDDIPSRPTIGFKFFDKKENIQNIIDNPLDMVVALIATMMDAHDKYYISDNNAIRTISIKTNGIKSTNFNITNREIVTLFNNGKNAAKEFFNNWDFENYKNIYRNQPVRI